MSRKKEIKWFKQPEEHNYPAAISYLTILYEENKAKILVDKLRKENIQLFKAKDIFRASCLSLLGISNSHVKKHRKKIQKGKCVSPILLVRDTHKVIIADGYHRLCAVYHYDEDIWIPCKIV